MRTTTAISSTLAVTVLLAGLVLVGGTKLVYPHDATPTAAKPQGWSYPFACCASFDCRTVGSTLKPAGGEGIVVSEKPEGFVINTTHEVIAYGDARLRDSPDGEYHWCSRAGSVVGQTICLFVPPRGF